jgi:hypothetical protein
MSLAVAAPTPPLPPRAARRRGWRLAVAALAALIAGGSAIGWTRYESASTPQDTVRGFLVAAVVDQDTVTACKYLTAHARAEIAALEPRDTPCEQGLMNASLTLGRDTVTTEAAVKRLHYNAQVRSGRGRVTVRAHGATQTFTLRKEPDASFAGPGPKGPWRIDTGVGALVAPGGA